PPFTCTTLFRSGRLARSISTHQIRRDARAALVQRLQKASDSRIELCRLFPMNEPARPWDLRSFLETLHSAQHLRLVGIGILVAADAEHGTSSLRNFGTSSGTDSPSSSIPRLYSSSGWLANTWMTFSRIGESTGITR